TGIELVGLLQFKFDFDFVVGKTLDNGSPESLNPPSRKLMTALSNLKSDPHLSRTPLQGYLDVIASSNGEYRYPGAQLDSLFSSSSIHVEGYDNCDNCDLSYLIPVPID
ncbi:hypothetical protein N7540_007015, partial [Penicillium herquei]